MSDLHQVSCSNSPVIVLLAEDHALVRDGLKLMISTLFANVEFLEADDAASLIRAMSHTPAPHLALVDLNMPGMDRGEALQEILSKNLQIPAMVVSALSSPDLVRRCLNLPSVRAFVSKNTPASAMKAAIRECMAGGQPGFVESDSAKSAAPRKLSPRLDEILGMLRIGMTNKAIAEKIQISEGTVKNYTSELFKLLNVTNRTQAARFDEELR